MKPRLILAGTRGPDVTQRLALEPAFGIATAAAHLRDALARMRRWSPPRHCYVALDGTSQIAVNQVEQALELLDTLSKQSSPDAGERRDDG